MNLKRALKGREMETGGGGVLVVRESPETLKL